MDYFYTKQSLTDPYKKVKMTAPFSIYSTKRRYCSVKTFMLVLTLLVGNYFWAQIGMSQWRLHVASGKAIDIVRAENTIFTAYTNGLHVLNRDSEQEELLTDVNGLSDIEISCLYYDSIAACVLVGYSNGNIDKITASSVYNIPAIKLAQVPNSKRINRFVRNGDYVYVATDFCVTKLDLNKDEIKDTYYPTNGNEAILDLSFSADTIFALSSDRLKYGIIDNPALPDVSQWQVDLRFPIQSENSYAEIEQFENKQFILLKSPIYGQDSVFYLENNVKTWLTNSPYSLEINSINILDDTTFAVNIDGGIYIYNSELTNPLSYNSNNFNIWISPVRSIRSSEGIWSADQINGLHLYPSGIGYKAFPVVGPYNNNFYAMDWQNNTLAIASGRLLGKLPSFSSNGIHVFRDEAWDFKNIQSVPQWQDQNIWDFIDISVNPNDPLEYAVASYSEKPLTIFSSDTVEVFDDTNSSLSLTGISNGWSLASDVCFDTQDNLWVLNGYTEQPLNVRQQDGSWMNFDCGSSARNIYTTKMIIDFNDNIWFASEDHGMFGYNHNNTIDEPNDDESVHISTGINSGNLPSSNVTALAADFDGEIWVGTDAGFAILYNASNTFNGNPGDYDVQRVKVTFEGNVEYVLGNTHITDIEVDGGNRKWIATANAGILLLSADGSEILEQHTTDNSPLVSNNIFDLKLDQNSGELFIITDNGLISYRSDASYEDPTYETYNVFPNPVRPNYSGPVTIQGIRYNSDVKITDAAGNLVYKTTSNGGTAAWNCRALNGQRVASGVYYIWTATNVGKDKKVGKVLIMN
ncbi:MAG: hypothetical protein CL855_07060 [Cryomorphaceae bacterium]|nr:hypothetical protein [Cryomorphaceae bacterium]